MPQNQEQIEARLCAYIDGELDAAGRAEIEKHLASNPVHRKLIEELSAQRDLIRDLPREKAPGEIAESIQGQLERSVLLGNASDAINEPVMHINRWPHFGAIAAVLVLTTGLAFLVYKVLPSNKPPGEFAFNPSSQSSLPAVTLDESTNLDKPVVTDKPTVTGTPAEGDRLATARAIDPERRDAAKDAAISAAGEGGLGAISPTVPAPSISAPSVAVLPTASADAGVADAGAREVTLSPDSIAAAKSAFGAGLSKSLPPANSLPSDGALAMQPGPMSNAISVTEQPLLNAMTRTNEATFSKDGLDLNASKENASLVAIDGGASVGSITMLVWTDDPAIAGEQVRAFLTGNQITWNPTVPMQVVTGEIATGQMAQPDVIAASRYRAAQVEVKQQTDDKKSEAERSIAQGAQPALNASTAPISDSARVAQTTPGVGAARTAQTAGKGAETAPATQNAPSATAGDVAASAGTATAPPASAPAAPATPVATLSGADQTPASPPADLTFYCRNVTPDQARELEGVLSARAGQRAMFYAKTTSEPVSLHQAISRAPTDIASAIPAPSDALPSSEPSNLANSNPPTSNLSTLPIAPTTQPLSGVVGSTPATSQPIVLNDALAQRDATQKQADQSAWQLAQDIASQQFNSHFNLNQQLSEKPGAAVSQQFNRAQQKLDLLILVRKDVNPTTVPNQEPAAAPTTR